jgi:hypothetical protein
VNATKVRFLMPAKKMRVELFDGEGNRYSISIEGEVTRDKALRILDLVELLGGMPSGMTKLSVSSAMPVRKASKFDKVHMVVRKHFPLVWFSSREIQYMYEQELREPISLSTVATYLARLAAKGFIMKTGAAFNLRYKISPSYAQATVDEKTQ